MYISSLILFALVQVESLRPRTQADALWTIENVTGRVVHVSDVDDDGHDDLMIECGPLHAKSDAIDLVSSRDGRRIRALWRADSQTDRARCWDAGGDLDGDGVSDLLLGFPDFDHARGCVLAISGKSAGILFLREGDDIGYWFGTSVAILPDIDCDGADEYVVGAPCWDVNLVEDEGWGVDAVLLSQRAEGDDYERGRIEPSNVVRLRFERAARAGHVSIRSGRSGMEIARHEGDRVGDAFGSRVDACPDLDGDGAADVLAQHDVLSLRRPTLLSGLTGRRITSRLPFDYTLRPAGDVDGDRRPDFITDRYDASALDMITGDARASFPAPKGWIFVRTGGGRSIGDVDGDGCDDIALTEPHFNLLMPGERADWNALSIDVTRMDIQSALAIQGEAWHGGPQTGVAVVFSGRTREPIFGVWGLPAEKKGLGKEVVALPDVSGDGYPDILVTDNDTAHIFRGPGPKR